MFVQIVTCIAIFITSSTQTSTNISGNFSEIVSSFHSAEPSKEHIQYLKSPDTGRFHEVIFNYLPSNQHYYSRFRRSGTPLSRKGRILLKLAAKRLPGLILGAGLLANSAGTGTLSASNSFNIFGKTINSALSLAYGDTGFVLPFAPGVPLVPGPFPPGAGLGAVATKTADQPISSNQARITALNDLQKTGQIEASMPNILDQYMEIQKLREKLLIEPTKSVAQPVSSDIEIQMESIRRKLLSDTISNNQIKTDQALAYVVNENERLKQFLRQHNNLVDQFNNKVYLKVPRVQQFYK